MVKFGLLEKGLRMIPQSPARSQLNPIRSLPFVLPKYSALTWAMPPNFLHWYSLDSLWVLSIFDLDISIRVSYYPAHLFSYRPNCFETGWVELCILVLRDSGHEKAPLSGRIPIEVLIATRYSLVDRSEVFAFNPSSVGRPLHRIDIFLHFAILLEEIGSPMP